MNRLDDKPSDHPKESICQESYGPSIKILVNPLKNTIPRREKALKHRRSPLKKVKVQNVEPYPDPNCELDRKVENVVPEVLLDLGLLHKEPERHLQLKNEDLPEDWDHVIVEPSQQFVRIHDRVDQQKLPSKEYYFCQDIRVRDL